MLNNKLQKWTWTWKLRLVLSWPHFLHAEDKYQDAVQGLR